MAALRAGPPPPAIHVTQGAPFQSTLGDCTCGQEGKAALGGLWAYVVKMCLRMVHIQRGHEHVFLWRRVNPSRVRWETALAGRKGKRRWRAVGLRGENVFTDGSYTKRTRARIPVAQG